jgi:glycosyltransferase involved in cell wall biosynthesis
MELISVIIPTYNHAKYLKRAVTSVLDQIYGEFEVLIIDDGSLDNTFNVCQELLNIDSRIKYFYQKNKGLSAARNYGLSIANGVWIQFLDADDLIDKNKFYCQINKIKSSNISYSELVLCFSDFIRSDIDDPNKELLLYKSRLPITNHLFLNDVILNWENIVSIPIHSFLYDIRYFKEYGLRFDESLKNHEDFDILISILSLNTKVVFCSEKLVNYTFSTKSMSSDINVMNSGFKIVLRKHLLLTTRFDIFILIKMKLSVLNRYSFFDKLYFRFRSLFSKYFV